MKKKPSKKTTKPQKAKPTKKLSKKKEKKPTRTTNKNNNDQQSLKSFIEESKKNIHNVPNEKQKKELDRLFGMILGKASKVMLENSGMNVNYQVNGEDITDIKKLNEMDLKQKIDLAIREERYEDAQKLKDILDNKTDLDKVDINKENLEFDINLLQRDNTVFQMTVGSISDTYRFIEEIRGRWITKETFISFLNISKGLVMVRIKNVDDDMVLVEVSNDDIMPHFFMTSGISKDYVKYVKNF